MTVSNANQTLLAADGVAPDFWLEIDGIPNAFGMTARTSGFFSGRAAAFRKDAVLALVREIPAAVDQQVRPLDADSSIGALGVSLSDDDSGNALNLVANLGRTDGQVPMSAQRWQASHAYSVGDVVRPTTASGAAGALHWFRCSTAGTSGGTEPDWHTVGVNGDNTAVWTHAGTQDLAADTASCSIPFTGAIDTTLFPSGGGTFFIGRETFTYTGRTGSTNGYFSGVSRAMYQLGSTQTPWAHTVGDLISPYPRFLSSRRIDYRCTLDSTDASSFSRFTGTVKNYKLGAGLTSVELEIESMESEFRSTAFATQRRFKSGYGLRDGDNNYDASSDGAATAQTSQISIAYEDIAGQPLTMSELIYFKLDNEILLAQVADTGSGFLALLTVLARGLFGTKKDQHQPGAELVEVAAVASKDLSGSAEFRYTKFTAGDHPLEVLLQLLCSRAGDGANGTYDTLPAGWGLGIDQARIDVTAIENLRDAWLPGLRYFDVWMEPFGAHDKISEILRALGCYYVTQIGSGKWTVRRLNPPTGALPSITCTTSDIVEVADWAPQIDDVFGRVLFRCDFDPFRKQFQTLYRYEIIGPGAEAQEFYGSTFKTLEIGARGLWTGLDHGDGFTVPGHSDVQAVAARRIADLVRDRYSKPPTALGVRCAYNMAGSVDVGDTLLLTVTNAPNVATGSRGFTSVVCEVVNKSIDDAQGEVILTLVQTAFASQYRLISPSATVASSGGGNITVNAHDFTASGGAADASHFVNGDAIEVWTPDLVTRRGATTVNGTPSGNNIPVAAIPGGTAAGDVVVCNTYDNATAARRALSAFLCGSTNPPTLGATAQAAPHQMA